MRRSITFFCTFLLLIIFSASSYAQPSGLLLGVNVFPVNTGLRVDSTISNTPADGVLYRGDILRFITAYNHPVYSAQRLSHLEKAKKAIGPNREAFLEILRNGNRMFFKVSFAQQRRPVVMMSTPGMSSPPPVASGLSIAPALGSEASSLFGDDVSSPSNNHIPRPNNSGGGVDSNVFD